VNAWSLDCIAVWIAGTYSNGRRTEPGQVRLFAIDLSVVSKTDTIHVTPRASLSVPHSSTSGSESRLKILLRLTIVVKHLHAYMGSHPCCE